MSLYKVESDSKNIYLIQEFVTVMAGLIMDYSGVCLCCPSNFEAMEEQEDANYLSFHRECKDYLLIFLNTKEKWMETITEKLYTQMVAFNGGNI